MIDVLVEIRAFLFGVLLRNPFSCSLRQSNVFSRTQPMLAETFPLLVLDCLLLGLGRLHAGSCMSTDNSVFALKNGYSSPQQTKECARWPTVLIRTVCVLFLTDSPLAGIVSASASALQPGGSTRTAGPSPSRTPSPSLLRLVPSSVRRVPVTSAQMVFTSVRSLRFRRRCSPTWRVSCARSAVRT